MATSSIFTNIKITDPKEAEAFVKALEQSAKDGKRIPTNNSCRYTTDPDEIQKILKKRYLRHE